MNLPTMRFLPLLGTLLLAACQVSEPVVEPTVTSGEYSQRPTDEVKATEPVVEPTMVSEVAVATLGKQLAAWANLHCTNIAIENEPILVEDGNAGGCSQVWWQHPEGQAFVERGDEMPAAIRPGAEQWHRKNEAAKSLLTEALRESECNLDQLLQQVALFGAETSKEEVAEHLSCLGEINFVPVEFGIE